MTEPRGRAARWTAAAVAAPVAAGLFAGTTAWATNADPLHASKPTDAGTPAPSASADPSLVALQEQLAASTHRMDQLAARVAAVQAQAVALSGGKVPAGTSAHGGTTTTTTTRRSGGTSSKATATKSHGGTSGSGTGSAPAPKPPPPPPQATTGASGVVH